MNSHTRAALQEWQAQHAAEQASYDAKTVAELKAEIEKRNVDRADDAKLPVTGNKPALIAALTADDESQES